MSGILGPSQAPKGIYIDFIDKERPLVVPYYLCLLKNCKRDPDSYHASIIYGYVEKEDETFYLIRNSHGGKPLKEQALFSSIMGWRSTDIDGDFWVSEENLFSEMNLILAF